MDGDTRRKKILEEIMKTEKPLSASKLANMYNVSRQIVVGDIALLRAMGHDIVATARGYLFANEKDMFTRVIAVCHDKAATEDELLIFVKHNICVVDVTVEHPIYGEITGNLNIRTQKDVARFIQDTVTHNSQLLLSLTNGIHLHTVQFKHERDYLQAKMELQEKGYLYQND